MSDELKHTPDPLGLEPLLSVTDLAEYLGVLVPTGRELAPAYGKGYDATNLRRMTPIARRFPDEGIAASVGRELSGYHFKTPLPV